MVAFNFPEGAGHSGCTRAVSYAGALSPGVCVSGSQGQTSGLVGHRRAHFPGALLCRPPLVRTCNGPEFLRGV